MTTSGIVWDIYSKFLGIPEPRTNINHKNFEVELETIGMKKKDEQEEMRSNEGIPTNKNRWGDCTGEMEVFFFSFLNTDPIHQICSYFKGLSINLQLV
jgi:hypothetical protein